MSETTKSLVMSVLQQSIKEGGIRKGRTPSTKRAVVPVCGGVVNKDVVRLRTFPSETAHHLITTKTCVGGKKRSDY